MQRSASFLSLAVLFSPWLGCSHVSSPPDASAPDLAISASASDAGVVDLAQPIGDGGTPDGGSAFNRASLTGCWSTASCARALLIAHGGEWMLANPAYGTTAAFTAAYTDGADAIKADLRFSKDGVPVVVHSSPFQVYEIDPVTFTCYNQKVEDMNVSDIVACRWINGDHVQRLDDLLGWAHGKLVVMLAVKDLTTLPQSVAAVIANTATDFAFLEITTPAMIGQIPGITGHDQVSYVVEAANQADVTSLLALHDPRVIMIEDATPDSFGGLSGAALTSLITTQLHPANIRAFTSIAGVSATAADHTALWNAGFDVIMTNSYGAGHNARVALNTMRGVTPP